MTKAMLALAILGLLSLAPRISHACGASQTPEWKLDGVLPHAGESIPTDAAFVIKRLQLEPVGNGAPEATNVVVTVKGPAGEILGTTEEWYGEAKSLVWKPKALLPPGAMVVLEASVGAP